MFYRPVSEEQEKGDGDAESLFGEIGVALNKVFNKVTQTKKTTFYSTPYYESEREL